MPETSYTRSGAVNIAYQVVGDGPIDLVYVPGWVSNIEAMWEDPGLARFLRRLASFSRLITFDKRGTGLSDPVSTEDPPTLETRMDDLRAVMDAAGAGRASLFGHSEGGIMCALFAATYPDRTDSLILTGSYAKRLWSPEYPWAPRYEDRMREIEETESRWGDPAAADVIAPSRAGDEAFRAWFSRYVRLSASPKMAAALLKLNTFIDVTPILPAIRRPTLLLYRTDDPDVKVDEGRYIASQIPGSKFVELPGRDHIFWVGDTERILEEIEEFLTGHRAGGDVERVLATILFTDIVGSTEIAAERGDRGWRDVLERHHATVRAELARWNGREVDTAGDGFLARFDGPARAIRCAQAICTAVVPLGIRVRCGLHTGEVEVVGPKIAGVAVHIGARIAALAGPGEVLVSRTIKDLVSGAGISFEPHGTHTLKGFSEPWEVLRVTS